MFHSWNFVGWNSNWNFVCWRLTVETSHIKVAVCLTLRDIRPITKVISRWNNANVRCVFVQLIFADQCTEVGGHCYHVDHYVCAECQCPLAGHQYVTLAGRPYCTNCFHSTYADYCCSCGRIIAAEQRHVAHTDRKWHDSCFRCGGCDRTLVGRSCLLIADGRVFCSDPDCANQRRDKLFPANESCGSDNVIEKLVQRQIGRRTLDKQHQLSADRIQQISRQTTV